jgi:long-chain fatty acid transport protein
MGSPDLGTAGAGMAALAADASTAFRNPAGMTHLDRSEFLGAAQGLYSDFQFDTDESGFGGGDGGNAGSFVPGGSLHYVHRATPDLRLGVTTGSYFGFGLDYGDTREVKLRFDQEGITIPFPQRDMHVYRTTENA